MKEKTYTASQLGNQMTNWGTKATKSLRRGWERTKKEQIDAGGRADAGVKGTKNAGSAKTLSLGKNCVGRLMVQSAKGKKGKRISKK